MRLTPEHKFLPPEVAYADDVDFLSLKEFRDVNDIQNKLAPHQLNVNTDKTEYTCVERKTKKSEESWRSTKKVGSLMGDDKDIDRRKSLSMVAMSKMNAVWFRKDKIKQQLRIRLYKSLIKSIQLYNCGSWGLTQNQEERLNSFHRRQLRKTLGIKYPTKISNANLYKICNEIPISTTITRARWKLFGHILRRDTNIPAYQVMQFYFTSKPSDKNFKGRARTTLPTTLARDLDRMYYKSQPTDHTYATHLRLRSTKDLELLRTTAQDRKKWFQLTERIVKAGQADTTVAVSAKDH